MERPTLYDQEEETQSLYRLLHEIEERKAAKRRSQRFDQLLSAGIAASIIIGGVAAGLRNSEDAETTKIDDGELRTAVDTPLEHDMTAIAIELSLDEDVVAICGDVQRTDQNPEDDIIPLGLHYRGSMMQSGKPTIAIDFLLCDSLEGPRDSPTSRTAYSVFTLAHEIAHAKGRLDEGLTNCDAVELYDNVAERLGYGESLQHVDELLLAQSTGPEIYHTAGC